MGERGGGGGTTNPRTTGEGVGQGSSASLPDQLLSTACQLPAAECVTWL